MGGHEFFQSWKLWQKMTFVLACGIVVTIFAGFIKVAIDRNKLRKYTKADKGKQIQTPDMLEAQPVTTASVESKDEIPFGIRAIQSGIEVDGVWISRSNTPVASSRASIYEEKLSRGYNSQLDFSKTGLNASSRTSSQAPSLFDRAVSAERLPNGSRSSSPGRRQTYIKCTNCNHNIVQGPSALESPQSGPSTGPPSPQEATHRASGRHSDKSSRRTSDESDYMNIQQDVRAYETAYIRPKDPRTDLQLLQSHRMSHVAETGQLTPRVRRPGNQGGDWTPVPDNQISSLNGVSYFIPQKTPSPPLPSAAVDQPDIVGVATSSRQTPEDPTANRVRQPMPLLESYAPKAAYYPDTYQPRGPHHQYSYDEVPYEVTTEQNHRDDQVLRKVNAGFEILKPGTFQPPTPEELDLAEKRQSKKLQKKRRTSDDSRQSIFVEQV